MQIMEAQRMHFAQLYAKGRNMQSQAARKE